MNNRAYPQYEFATAILSALQTIGYEWDTVLDMPCGKGETSYILANALNKKVLGIDHDSSKIDYARRVFRHPDLHFEADDITEVLSRLTHIEILCIINSLFVLPNAGAILRLAVEKMTADSRLLIVLPNTDSDNFKTFQRLSPATNQMTLNRNDMESYFSSCGLTTEYIKGIVFEPYFGRRDTRLLYPVRHWYLRWLSTRKSRKPHAQPCYFLAVLKKAR